MAIEVSSPVFDHGGIIPEAHTGAASGDVLRLQYLNNVEIETDEVHTASDFGRELLDLIIEQKDSLPLPQAI
jgi:hypothetical protein